MMLPVQTAEELEAWLRRYRVTDDAIDDDGFDDDVDDVLNDDDYDDGDDG